MNLEFYTDLKKNTDIKFHENPSSGGRVIPCGKTDVQTDGRTDMTKQVVGFRNFSKAPKNKCRFILNGM